MSDPKLLGNILQSPSFQRLNEEMRRVLKEREQDPRWQEQFSRQERAGAKTKLERQLLVIESSAMGNYGPEAKAIAEQAKRRVIRIEDACNKLRQLIIKGGAQRVDNFRPPNKITLSDEQFRHIEEQQMRIGAYDPAEEWER